jgi:hypothetical protein
VVPRVGSQPFDGVVGADAAAGGELDPKRAGDLEHVADVVLLAEAAQCAVAAVHLVAGGPRRRLPRVVQRREQIQRELRLGPERDRVVDAGLSSTLRVVGPLLRQVGHSCGDGVPARRGVGAVDDVDGVGYLPHAAGILAFDSGGEVALLLLRGLVKHRHRELVGQVGDDEVAHRGRGGALVPRHVVEQTLHPVRRPVPGVLGQRPPVLAWQVSQQPVDVLARLRPYLPASERARQLGKKLGPLRPGQIGGLYHEQSSRLVFVCRSHNHG